MQRAEVKFMVERNDFSLMVITLTPPVVEPVIELFGIPLLPREGGFLVVIPHRALDESLISDGEAPEMSPSWLGVGTIQTVPMVRRTSQERLLVWACRAH